jgi:hypothetical protein
VRELLIACCTLVALTGCAQTEAPPEAEPTPSTDYSSAWFEPVSAQTGIDFTHVRATQSRFWFPEIMSGGAAWLDYDLDGDLDAYLIQGGDLTGASRTHGNRLFRNDGDRFVDVTDSAGVGDAGYGMGAVVGDLDNDGYPDVYVTNVGPNALYRNNRDGTFDRIRGGDVGDPSWGASGAAVDYDLDGDLDLYIVNYVTWSARIETDCYGVGGSRDYCHPSRYQAPASDTLLRNDGGMRFTNVSEELGLLRAFGNGLGVTLVDMTGSRSLDVYVANDGMPNQLWSRIDEGFEDVAVPRGCSVNGFGAAEAGMGVASADVDGDGRSDILLTHLARETNTLYLDRGGMCEDATAAAGLGAASLAFTGFGTALADFDNDGEIDLWVSNGRVGREDIGTEGDPFAEPDHVYRGSGGPRFELLPAGTSGVGRAPDNSRGAAFGDYDSDGDVDALVIENGGSARLYRNRASDGSWVVVRLWGEPAARVGALATTVAGGRERVGRSQRAYSYCSSNDPAIHIGLGQAARVEELRLRDPGGGQLVLRDLPSDRAYNITR